VHDQLQAIANDPKLTRAFFKNPDVANIADC